jgi:hypothetical protein
MKDVDKDTVNNSNINIKQNVTVEAAMYTDESKKMPLSILQNSVFTCSPVEIDYIPMVKWILSVESIEKTVPFVGDLSDRYSIDSAINRVINVIENKGMHGTIAIEKTAVNNAPAQEKVGVTFL